MSRYIDIDAFIADCEQCNFTDVWQVYFALGHQPSVDIVRCRECKNSHIDGKTTHYLWCTEWGRSTDTFGYCERGEREGE